MNDDSIFDRMRAAAQDRLTRDEREAHERELAADPALRALAEDYRLVHALTAHDPLPALDARTTLAELERRMPGARPLALGRFARVAGILVISTGSFLAGWWARRDPAPLYLRSIELNATLASDDEPADLPQQWADYDPRGEQGVRFLSGLAEAELLARAVDRPLLVYGSYPGCPLCAALDARVFSDPAVVELAERTVPVRINLADLPEAEQQSLVRRGYPFLEMWRDDGRTTHSLARNPDPRRFVESLHDGIEKSDATGEQPPWSELRACVARLGGARSAELAGQLGEAERLFRELAGEPRAPELIVQRAAAGLRRISADARAVLLEARAAAANDPALARRLLERALERHAHTSFEADLRAALERLLRDGRFPLLAEVDRSA